jgi:GR25 family glycosyltransferase involved in LPS biosynthesis
LEFFARLDIEPEYTPVVLIADLKTKGLDSLLEDGIIDNTYYEFLQSLNEPEINKFYGKIACSLSHINACKEFLKSGDTVALIFEDDNHIPDKGEVGLIKQRINNAMKDLNNEYWVFCNLSPCITDKTQIHHRRGSLYTGKLGYCMNAYLITESGASKFINILPLTKEFHTLDAFLPDYGKKFPNNVFEVHPRIFEQKHGHSQQSTLGNTDFQDTIPEYAQEIKTASTSTATPPPNHRNWKFVLIFTALFIATVIVYFIYKKTIIIIIGVILACGFWLYLHRIRQNYEYLQGLNMYTKNAGYRLGDMVKYTSWRRKDGGEQYHYQKFPNSIASEYMRLTNKENDYDILLNIVRNRSKTVTLPKANELVIHLRTGDVMDQNNENTVEEILADWTPMFNGFNSRYYTPPLKYFADKIPVIRQHKITTVILVSGSHINIPTPKSHQYISAVKNFFEKHGFTVKLRIGKDPDEDFIFMCNSKFLIAFGEGGYSELVRTMGSKAGNTVLSSQEEINLIQYEGKCKQSYLALIIEPRPGPMLGRVVRNFATILDARWRIVIMHGTENRSDAESAADAEPPGRVELRNMNVSNITIPQYSDIMLSESLWRSLPAEHVLVFQTDTAISHNHSIDEFLEYDYVGAPWSAPIRKTFPDGTQNSEVGNGGLSLRRKSAMLRAVKDIHDNTNPEDIYLVMKMCELGGFNIAPLDVAARFSAETMIVDKTPFGIHKPWPYHDAATLRELCATPEFRSLLEWHQKI